MIVSLAGMKRKERGRLRVFVCVCMGLLKDLDVDQNTIVIIIADAFPRCLEVLRHAPLAIVPYHHKLLLDHPSASKKSDSDRLGVIYVEMEA